MLELFAEADVQSDAAAVEKIASEEGHKGEHPIWQRAKNSNFLTFV